MATQKSRLAFDVSTGVTLWKHVLRDPMGDEAAYTLDTPLVHDEFDKGFDRGDEGAARAAFAAEVEAVAHMLKPRP